MFFTVDGLLVERCDGGASGDILGVSDGRQLIVLHRLLHRLHSSKGDLQEDGRKPFVGGGALLDPPCGSVGVTAIGENTNLVANDGVVGLARWDDGSDMSGGVALVLSTSERTLSCAQRKVPDTGDTLFWCTATAKDGCGMRDFSVGAGNADTVGSVQ
ncbi:unnamed protein product [Trypanosoma congolense IL3000]|uniref:WGS project CAEQ00000000 data, annotated contig 1450 n=1 Tax=Trypanosoma congolense (strain IL3000) TaxID=1068625 RepID=F9W6D7_TRYCI|nr:unnamed protein product [Trypanosoma congolense IL3000]